MPMTETERYLFDLNGYIVIRGILSEGEIQEINKVIDRSVPPSWDAVNGVKDIMIGFDQETTETDKAANPAYAPLNFYAGQLLDWGKPIRDLVAHPIILSYMIELIGPTLRLDHQYVLLIKPNAPGQHLHGAGTPYDPMHYYHFRDNRFHNGLVTASYALTDVPSGKGGFCCIPGSHKSNLRRPRSIHDLRGDVPDCVVQVAPRRGDVVLFTEALSHGTLPWKADFERRAIFFKYAAGHMQCEQNSPFTSMDHDWDDIQQALLRRPYYVDRTPVIESKASPDLASAKELERASGSGPQA